MAQINHRGITREGNIFSCEDHRVKCNDQIMLYDESIPGDHPVHGIITVTTEGTFTVTPFEKNGLDKLPAEDVAVIVITKSQNTPHFNI